MYGAVSLLITLVPCAAPALGTQVRYTENTTYFSLVQEWPQSTCISFQESKPCFIPKDAQPWLIHGLWMEIGRSPPKYCNISTDFKLSSIQELMPDLNKYWPSVRKNKGKEWFWKHEWDSHGRCATIVPKTNDEYKYFKETLALRKDHNVYRMLSRAGIEPAANVIYPIKSVIHGIDMYFEHTPYIECVTVKGTNYLMRVFLCFDTDLKPMDCPLWRYSQGTESRHECENKVAYPPIKY